MSDQEIEPMNADLRDLLRASAPPLAAPKGMDAKLLARLSTSIPDLGGGPSGGGGGGATATKAVGAGTGVKVAIGVGAVSLALAGVAAFGTGGKSDTVSVRPPVITTIATSTSAKTESPSRSNDVPTLNVDSLPSAPNVRAPSAVPSASAGDAVAEHAILDDARNALGRGDTAAALAAIERHQARYPSGALSEEREVLAIRTLAAAGRANDAHARAARFRARYPKSMFLPAVDAALAR